MYTVHAFVYSAKTALATAAAAAANSWAIVLFVVGDTFNVYTCILCWSVDQKLFEF